MPGFEPGSSWYETDSTPMCYRASVFKVVAVSVTFLEAEGETGVAALNTNPFVQFGLNFIVTIQIGSYLSWLLNKNGCCVFQLDFWCCAL